MKKITRRSFVGGAALASLAMNTIRTRAATGDDARFDFVIAGAGHNSLITAAYLAKAGFSVVVLEGRPTIGGGCKTAEACLPGFKNDLCSSVHSLAMSNPIWRDNELGLFDYGLEYIDPDPIMHIQFLNRESITIWQDHERTWQEYAKYSKRDADTFRRLVAEFRDYRADPAKYRNTGVWRRRFAMSGYDLVHETFEHEYIRTFHLAVGRFSSVPGGDTGTGNQLFTLVAHQLGGRPLARGGSGMLAVALRRVIEAHGGVILTNKPVAGLIIESEKCVGVECVDGDQYRANNAVVSTIHIKHLVDMAPARLWGADFLSNVDLYQPEPAMFSFNYATAQPVTYPLAHGGSISPPESVLLGNPERILRLNYEHATGEIDVDGMPLQIVCASIADPSRAPAGYHTLKLEGNLPYQLKRGPQHWDNIKYRVADEIFAYFRQFSPGLTDDKILAKFIQSPLDIERWNPAMWRGSVHAGEYGPAQSGDMRPVPGWANYRMPITGLYQTGACTAPGGSVTGRPGRNAAAVILKDYGTSIAEVIGNSTDV